MFKIMGMMSFLSLLGDTIILAAIINSTGSRSTATESVLPSSTAELNGAAGCMPMTGITLIAVMLVHVLI